jgi:hypothetical protein
VFDVDVPEDQDVGVELLLQSGDFCCTAFDDSLVGGVGSDEDVAPDEVGPGDVGDGEGLLTCVAQHVDTDLHLRVLDHLLGDGGHSGHGVGREVHLEQRCVTDVLYDAGVEAGVLELVCLRKREFCQLFHGEPAFRGTWERRHVDHADDGLRGEETCEIQRRRKDLVSL